MIEPLNHPVWPKRCRCLASLFSGPTKGTLWVLVQGAAIDTDPWHAAQLSDGKGRTRATFKPKPCQQCTQDFIPTGHRQSFCSSKCKARYRSRRAA